MILELRKFGEILNSRSSGREAVLRAKQILNGSEDPKLVLDFEGVKIVTPSFADEFIRGVRHIYPNKTVSFLNQNEVIVDVMKELKLVG